MPCGLPISPIAASRHGFLRADALDAIALFPIAASDALSAKCSLEDLRAFPPCLDGVPSLLYQRHGGVPDELEADAFEQRPHLHRGQEIPDDVGLAFIVDPHVGMQGEVGIAFPVGR